MIQQSETSRKTYLFLAALFIAALVVCNLIANKFISIDLGFKTFIISAGVLPYPMTFLITDILSEIYGKKKTAQVVWAGFAASVFVLGVLLLAQQFDAIEGSPVNTENFNTVFGNSWRVILASMMAYLCAQMVDVRIYHFGNKKQLENIYGSEITSLPFFHNLSIPRWLYWFFLLE